MQWIAPAEKDTATDTLEKRLWDAADQFRANSGLKPQEYSGPILGLIFLRFAEVRFLAQHKKLEKAEATSRRGSRVDDPAAYHADGILYLPAEARFDYLLNRPESDNIGAKVNAAMRDIEKNNPQLAGVLPKTYNLFTSTLLKELLKKISEIPATMDYDAFGRIYEYFLGEFAMTEGQGGGEFYTPSSIVRLLTEVIEPYHGRILDPACGSGGMFVSSARFVLEHKKNPTSELAIHGVEKTDETGRLCRMNLAVHGLEGDIKHGGNINSYYDDPHNATGRFDFALANPPFNVNSVDKERLKDSVGSGRRFPFGLPRTDNANYLWIQLFYSALNEKGRAGFVMANSASDARSSEQDLRKKLIESYAVDVMVAVGPNMFYTVTLPCTLWFLDKGKAKTPRADTVLFIDVRHIYRQIDRAHREWTQAQTSFIANIVRLYRGEDLDFTLGGKEAQAKIEETFGKKPKYVDVAGLCYAATLKEIEDQGWSLNPGRYVGVVAGEAVSDEDFNGQLETLNENLETLNAQARALEQTIAGNVAEIFGGVTMVAATARAMQLGDVIRFGNGKAIKPGGEGCYPVYGSNGIIGGCDEFRYENGVIIGRVGAYCGAVLYCPKKFWASDNTLVAFPANDGFDTKFLYYLLTDAKLSRYAGGAAQPLVTQTVLKQVEVIVPALPVQQRIAGILSAYDDLIENSQQRIRILEAMARALYREWFVNFRFPGYDKVKMVSSSLGNIPQGWEVKLVKDILSRCAAGTVYREADVKPEGAISVYDQSTNELLGFHDNEPDQLASAVKPMAIFGDHTCKMQLLIEPFSVGPNVVPFVADRELPTAYVFYAVNSLVQTQEYKRHWISLNAKEIVVADRAIAECFALLIQPMLVAQATLRKVIRNLRKTRDLLLPRLLTGQVELKTEAG